MRFTVLGATGFIGGRLVERLRGSGHDVFVPARGDDSVFSADLGRAIYCAGVTADFRTRPFDTLRANTTFLADILAGAAFASLTYLSSTRVYRKVGVAVEGADSLVNPSDGEDLYDLTKLTAEAMCHASGRACVRVARLSNVIGPDFTSRNFLFDIIRSACDHRRIDLRTSLTSAKDYVRVEDVTETLIRIAVDGTRSVYNVGSGKNTLHADIVKCLTKATGAYVEVAINAPTFASAPIDVSRIENEFGFRAKEILPYVHELIEQYKDQRQTRTT